MKSKKLSRREFARVVREGRGSAFQHVNDHGLRGRKKVLLAALQENPHFCSIEGGCGKEFHMQKDRADWLLRLLDATGASEYFVGRFEKLLVQENWVKNSSDDALSQITYLSACLFERGHISLKPLLLQLAGGSFKRVRKNPELIAKALLKVAYIEGFDLLVELLADCYNWQYAAVYETAADVMGSEEAVDDFLAERRSLNEGYAKFSYVAKRACPLHLNISLGCNGDKPTLQNVVERIEYDRRAVFSSKFYGNFGERACDGDLHKIVERLEKEADVNKIRSYLSIFEKVDLPVVSPRVLSLLDHANSSVRDAALNVFRRLKNPQIRVFALDFLLSGNLLKVEFALRLLCKNYEDSDLVVIAKVLKRVKLEHARHRIGECLLELLAVGPRSFRPLAHWVVEQSPCCHCRRAAMELLLEFESVPSSFFVEAQWDVDTDLRRLAAQRSAAFYKVSGARPASAKRQVRSG